jgi:hypothetical protein
MIALSRERIEAAKARAGAALHFDGHPDDWDDVAHSAVEDVPAIADALLRVLEIHTEKHGESPRYAPDDVMHDGPIVGWEPYTMCAGCGVSPFPCATVRAVTGDGSSSNTERSEQ